MRDVRGEEPALSEAKGATSNHSTFNLQPSTLLLRTKRTSSAIVIDVEDNGPGIPADIKDKILQPFFTTKKGTEGTGLGLSITHDIVKAHGGSLGIHSQPGQTVFSIQLPV
jgi:signal transduction histidine kinase